MAAHYKPVRITAPTSRGVALDWEVMRLPIKYLEWFRKYGTTNTYVSVNPEKPVPNLFREGLVCHSAALPILRH